MADVGVLVALKLAVLAEKALNADVVFRESDSDRILIQLAEFVQRYIRRAPPFS